MEEEPIEQWAREREEKRKKKEERKANPFGSRRQALRPVSKKQSKRNKDYAQARQVHYSNDDNKVCFLCGRTENLSIHHTKGRGSNTADGRTYYTMCILGDTFRQLHPELNLNAGSGGCHGIIHANPKWARENDYLD